ncbi:MAG: aminotransferase class I/II-fold pyridoxal phosphate-dependent enzyme, partial [Candidatus Obscuribacterales bacterium]|nr:aminotransferase class I/II-fold pyridoxal phosphate-dependent enzyme [Candidatus Obscuribacterales bacterium]
KGSEDAHDLSYEDLHDLSNYCFNQGILEDRFGLPLIARALEEAQLCLSPQGSLTLILGGRPGQEAIEEMFRRRAYIPHLVWVRRIQQADDTDLVQLVNLEEAFGIKFHFFVSPNSRMSIPASTAVGLKARGEKIYHDLLVYQADTQFEKPTLGFLNNLHRLGLDKLRRELDLSRLTDEQVCFLERLSKELLKNKTIPYPHEKGDLPFREKLAKFLSFYCYYNANPEDLFVGPERRQLLSMILKMVSLSGDKVLLSSSLEPLYAWHCKQQGLDIVLGNNDLSELLQLDTVFAPRICIIAPYQLKDPSPLVLDSLIKQAEAHPDRCYLIDDSEHFEIGSEIQSNLLLRLLGEKKVPDNLIFLYGLIKNTVFPDFELSFLINAPSEWVNSLEYGAELSYSRISYIIQLYYEWLFDELLSFPFAEGGAGVIPHKTISGISLSPHFMSVAADPVFDAKPIDLEQPDLIRLDYGEFEAPVPNLLVKGLLKGFLESRSDALPEMMQQRVASYVLKTRHATIDPCSVVLGQGVFPLVGALIQALRERLGRPPVVALPRGSYGSIFPLLSYFNAEVDVIETSPSRAFVLSADDILGLKRVPDLLFVSQPSNPSGIFVEAEMVRKIIKVCAEKGIYIFSDEIFFLL